MQFQEFELQVQSLGLKFFTALNTYKTSATQKSHTKCAVNAIIFTKI